MAAWLGYIQRYIFAGVLCSSGVFDYTGNKFSGACVFDLTNICQSKANEPKNLFLAEEDLRAVE